MSSNCLFCPTNGSKPPKTIHLQLWKQLFHTTETVHVWLLLHSSHFFFFLWTWEIPKGYNLSWTVSSCQTHNTHSIAEIGRQREWQLYTGVPLRSSSFHRLGLGRSHSLHLKLYYTALEKHRKDGWMNGMRTQMKPEEDFFFLGRYGPTYIQCIVIWELQSLREPSLGVCVYF